MDAEFRDAELQKAQTKRAADSLRKLADDLEKNPPEYLFRCDMAHFFPVIEPELGGMVVDQKYLGTTIIISTYPREGIDADKLRAVIEGKL